MKIAVVTGSTRPGRNNEAVARWAYELAHKRTDAEFELVDIKDYHLPLLDEPVPASLGQYIQPHTKAWAAKIAAFDAYVFVTPEYNHSTSAALKSLRTSTTSPRSNRTLAASRKCIRCSIKSSLGAERCDRSEHHWLNKQCARSDGGTIMNASHDRADPVSVCRSHSSPMSF